MRTVKRLGGQHGSAEFGNWDGERLGLLSEMRLGSLGTVQSFLVRCNWSQFCVEMKRKEAWVFGNGSVFSFSM